MHRAIELARHGAGNTSPNPMVGAVITDTDGNIIGEGYHRCYGKPHAEVNAIASVSDKSRLKHSSIYVTLEPCSHYGKTPPCAKLIIDSGIREVIVGASDPFGKVNGRGIAMMRDAGIHVTTGILEKECMDLNAAFFTAHTFHRPFVTLKWAQSADGFMDIYRMPGEPQARISTPLTMRLMHRLRSMNDAILVGSGTIIADNPSLTTRLWPGRSPRPVIMDRRKRIGEKYGIMTGNPTVIHDDVPLGTTLRRLYDSGITSLLVEGGAGILRSFIDAGMWDMARIEVSQTRFLSLGRVKAPEMAGDPAVVRKLDGNMIKIYSQNRFIDVKNL